ncbi:MAG: hypothetical protein Q8O67_29105 [Deltaproteobacteria bacterium]|nr:hypothetical protein [Deltaproteobacteria bacterium]
MTARADLQKILSRGHTVEDVARACDVFGGILQRALEGEPIDGSPQLERLLRVFARDDGDAALRELLLMPLSAWPAAHPSATAWPLFLALLPTLRTEGHVFALGGARALALHGVERDTHDVDLFFAEPARRALQLFRDHGCSVGYFAADHLVARPAGSTQIDDVIDVHFPIVEPARSGLRRARDVEVDGVLVPVLPIVALVASKLMSGSGPQNEDAFLALDARVVTPRRLRAELVRLLGRPRVHDRFRRVLDDVEGALDRLDLWRQLRGV